MQTCKLSENINCQKIVAPKILPDYQIQEGIFFNLSHYHTIINNHCDVYDEKGILLFSLRKKAIPTEISNIARTHLLPSAMKCKNNNRYMASGKIKGAVKSMIAGYYDKAKRRDVSYIGVNDIRLTAFSEKHPIEWNSSIIYVQYLDRLYSELWKENYNNRKTIVKNIGHGIIPGTVFTTLTLNYNFRTACHIDKGDTGYSILTTIGNWNGCYLGYPQYGICANIEEGDFLIMNPHEYHCNTEFNGNLQNRMSIVTYSRKGIIYDDDDF
jgi:hypothetical protein